MLGAFGMGAVIGALIIAALRARLSGEASVRLCAMAMGVGVAVVAVSRSPALTASALLLAGAAWTPSVTLFNVGVQLAAPRWVAGRALAAYQAAISGGIAVGSWGWGAAANALGVEGALLVSAAVLFRLAAARPCGCGCPRSAAPTNWPSTSSPIPRCACR